MSENFAVYRHKWYMSSPVASLIGTWLFLLLVSDRSEVHIYSGIFSSVLIMGGVVFLWVKSMEFNQSQLVIHKVVTSRRIDRDKINGYDEFGEKLFVNLTDGSKCIVPLSHIDQEKRKKIKEYLINS